MDEQKNNVIPFPKRNTDSNVCPIISSDYWGDTFPLQQLLEALDKAKKDKES